ncbi:sensor histidine kinase [Pontibacter actiniarum]|uniref:sensor histidine kinase n=1 Tax=Pontibacter actiniarum TaxID=323450 RepID=UPI00042143BA|nr:HAMP domain-containing sensor histidine kinase [Pontibacter actiniarum]
MRLLHKTTLLYLLATTLILAAAGVTLMLVIRKLVDDEINEELRLQLDLETEQIATGRIPNNPMSTVELVPDNFTLAEEFGDSLLYDRVQDLDEEYKYLRKTEVINGQNYRITVMDSHVGWEEFSKTISWVFAGMALLLIVAGAVINYMAARTIWKPFFQNLNTLKQFTLSTPKPVQLKRSNIQEFEELRNVLEEMTRSSWQEYTSLREFTENASHETQTPLAIIRSKLDRLSQYPVSEEMAAHIVHAKSGVERLSRMNKNLLLLAKLENNAFTEKQELDFRQVVIGQAEQMEELFTLRELQLSLNCEPVTVRANLFLVETLVSNLLANALRYTPQHGSVEMELNATAFTVRNSGPEAKLPQEQLFKRFKKGEQNSASNGLGLAIVQEIGKAHGWQVTYTYQQAQHRFSVRF